MKRLNYLHTIQSKPTPHKTRLTVLISIVVFLSTFSLSLYAQAGLKSFVTKSKCVGCGDCTRVCPVKAITLQDGKAIVDPAICIGCRLCVKACSYGAVK